jgi:hypothetical protein
MVKDNISKEEKISLLKKAADTHQKLYRDAMNGKGIDRHLFALYVCCKGLNHVSEHSILQLLKVKNVYNQLFSQQIRNLNFWRKF